MRVGSALYVDSALQDHRPGKMIIQEISLVKYWNNTYMILEKQREGTVIYLIFNETNLIGLGNDAHRNEPLLEPGLPREAMRFG
jgi:hypothetical protein